MRHYTHGQVVGGFAEALFYLTVGLIAFVLGGCGATFAAKAPRPCLTTLPTKARFTSLHDPEKIPYLDESGEPRAGFRITVDAESAAAFFNYVENLEAIAQKALGCKK